MPMKLLKATHSAQKKLNSHYKFQSLLALITVLLNSSLFLSNIQLNHIKEEQTSLAVIVDSR